MRRNIALIFAALAVSVLVMELAARAMGHQPWSARHQHPIIENSQVVFETDPVLGWRDLPGRFEFQRKDGKTIVNTNLVDGARATGPGPEDASKQIVFVGGSYTYGWELTDGDTLAALTQEAFPGFRVRNYGTGGHGAYQSLLRIERILAETGLSPTIFVYGFSDFHQPRDVATHVFLRNLSTRPGSSDKRVMVPYVSLDAAGELVRHPPEAYGDWPLKRYSALVTLAEKAFYAYMMRERDQYRQRPTMLVIKEMSETVTKTGRHRLVVLVMTMIAQPGNLGRYTGFFESEGITYVNCRQHRTPDLSVMGRGHPNETSNRNWARCLREGLSSLLRDPEFGSPFRAEATR